MRSRILPLLALPLLGACDDESSPTAAFGPDAPVASASSAPPPSTLASVAFDGQSYQIWPYTDTNFEGTPQDPVNLVFAGRADPRNIRSALLSLSGDRSVAPFSTSGSTGALLAGVAGGCTWKDAVAGNQTGYSAAGGWAGSVIQLECGNFNGFRFHMRLFPAGQLTVANVHADVIIPGTNQHEVISWEAAEKFVMMELVRSGLLAAAPAETAPINEAPSFGVIRMAIYNGMPAGLQLLNAGQTGPVSADVPVATDGKATILSLREAPRALGRTNNFTITFGQVIPKPFCAQPGELIKVTGPVQVSQVVTVSSKGVLESKTLSKGTLTVQSFDPRTGALGAPVSAEVEEEYEAEVEDSKHKTTSKGKQELLGAIRQVLETELEVGWDGTTFFHAAQSCGS